jgi:ATP-dependent Clp protease adaptor protein ClpS
LHSPADLAGCALFSQFLLGSTVQFRQDGGMPTSNDKEDRVAVLPAKARPAQKPKVEKLPPFNVVLLDDDDHTYEYVIEMLGVVCHHSVEKAFAMAKAVDSEGRVIVLTTHKELAELKCDQIHSFGIDDRMATCKGSMTAFVEPAD